MNFFTSVLNYINLTTKQNEASSSFRACFCYLLERRPLLSQVKRQSCLLITLEPIRRISQEWSTCFVLTLAPTAEVVRWDFQERRGGRLPHLLFWTDSGMCEGATYGKVVPSRLSHLRSVRWRQSLKCFFKRKNKAAVGSLVCYLHLIV